MRNVKITSPDYKGWEPGKAVEDYMGRIRDQERYYEPVDEPDWPWIRIINVWSFYFDISCVVAEHLPCWRKVGEKIMVNVSTLLLA